MVTADVRPFPYSNAASPRDRARDVLAAIQRETSDTPEGRALWHACDGLRSIVNNHDTLGFAAEAIAVRMAGEYGGDT